MTNPSNPGATGSPAGKAFGAQAPAAPVNLYADAMDQAIQFATIPGAPGTSTTIDDLIGNASKIYDFISKK